MTQLDLKTIEKVAGLAHLALSEEEKKSFLEDLKHVLNYIDQLKEISVEGVRPLTHPLELKRPLREDQVFEFERTEQKRSSVVLESAPQVLSGHFQVPSILSTTEESHA